MKTTNSKIKLIKAPSFFGEYRSDTDERFNAIKSFVDGHYKICVYACQHHDLSQFPGSQVLYSDAGQSSSAVAYRDKALQIAQDDFKIYSLLLAKESAQLHTWMIKNTDAYYRLFNRNKYLEISDQDLIRQLLALYLYPNGDFPTEAFVSDPDQKPEFDFNTLVNNSDYKDLVLGQRRLFEQLIQIKHSDFKLDNPWADGTQFIDVYGPAILNGFRRIFLERKRIFLQFIRANLKSVKANVILKNKSKKPDWSSVDGVLEKYQTALGEAQDYVIFDILPFIPMDSSDAQQETALNTDEKEQAYEDTIKQLIKIVERGQQDLSNWEDIDKKLKEIHAEITKTDDVEKTYKLSDALLADSFLKTKDANERRKLAFEHIKDISSVAASDIASWIVNFAKGDADFKDLAEDLAESILPMAAGAIAALFGGPVGNAFVQGLVGALIGSPPNPLMQKLKDLDHKLDQIEKVITAGFRAVLRQTDLLLQGQEEIKQQIEGLSEKMESAFQALSEKIKEDLKIENFAQDIQDPIVNKILPAIDNIKSAHENLFPKPDGIHHDFENLDKHLFAIKGDYSIQNILLNVVRAFYSGDYDYNKNLLELNASDRIAQKIIANSQANSFAEPMGVLVELCNYIDRTMRYYGAQIENHFAVNAAIACYYPDDCWYGSDPAHSKQSYEDLVKELVFTMEQGQWYHPLMSHGMLFSSLIIGPNNMVLYGLRPEVSMPSEKSKFAVEKKHMPVFMDGFVLAQVDDKGHIRVNAMNFPICISFKDGKITSSDYPTRHYLDFPKPGKAKHDYTFLSLDKHEWSARHIPGVQLSLSHNDCLILSMPNNDDQTVRLIPFDYEFRWPDDTSITQFFGPETPFYCLEHLFTLRHNLTEYQANAMDEGDLTHHLDLPNSLPIRLNLVNGYATVYPDKHGTTIDLPQTVRESKLVKEPMYRIERSDTSKTKIRVVKIVPVESGDIAEKENKDFYAQMVFSPGCHKIIPDQIMGSGARMYSDNYKYYLDMQAGNGNLVLYRADGSPTWAFGETHQKTYLRLDSQGSLSLNTSENSFPLPQKKISSIYIDEDKAQLWLDHEHPITGAKLGRRLIASVLRRGEHLYPGEFLYSEEKSGRQMAHLILQTDGNLVQYSGLPETEDKSVIWDTHTALNSKLDELKLEISSNKRLTLHGIKGGDFTFPQSIINSLFLEKYKVMINRYSKTTDQVDSTRRLMAFIILPKDTLFGDEKIYSLDRRSSFYVQAKDGNMHYEDSQDPGNNWWSMKFKDRNPSYQFKLMDYQVGHHNSLSFCSVSGDYAVGGFYIAWKDIDRDKKPVLFGSYNDLNDFWKENVIHLIELGAIYISSSGSHPLTGLADSTAYDIGLVSDSAEHACPKIVVEEWVKRLIGYVKR